MDNLVPTMLGAVVGTAAQDAEVLTGSGCGCNACDACTDYAYAGGVLQIADSTESR